MYVTGSSQETDQDNTSIDEDDLNASFVFDDDDLNDDDDITTSIKKKIFDFIPSFDRDQNTFIHFFSHTNFNFYCNTHFSYLPFPDFISLRVLRL